MAEAKAGSRAGSDFWAPLRFAGYAVRGIFRRWKNISPGSSRSSFPPSSSASRCLVSWLLANLGGWARLAQTYRAQPGRRIIGATHFGMASARRQVSYNNCLILDASPGLRLAIW
ncbi:MAG: hypothetical protein R3F11_18695 [Verrucomicrobiales bacterium]